MPYGPAAILSRGREKIARSERFQPGTEARPSIGPVGRPGAGPARGARGGRGRGLDDLAAVYIETIPSPQVVRLFTQAGNRVPLHATGAGKALLAALPAARRDSVLDRLELRPYTPHTIVDAAVLRRAVEEIRERGYAIDDEEYDDGVRCVAVPVMGAPNELIGSLSISAPANRLTRQRCTELVPLLRRSASELAAALREKTEPSA